MSGFIQIQVLGTKKYVTLNHRSIFGVTADDEGRAIIGLMPDGDEDIVTVDMYHDVDHQLTVGRS